MMRSQPLRVNIACCTAISSGVPLVQPAADLRVLALVVLAHDHHVDVGRRRGRRAAIARPEAAAPGRRLTYCWKPRRIGISRPQSETWSGTPGKPTAPRKIASNFAELLEPVLRHHAAGLRVALAAPVERRPLEARSRSGGRPPRARACLRAPLPCRSRRRESPRSDASSGWISPVRSAPRAAGGVYLSRDSTRKAGGPALRPPRPAACAPRSGPAPIML